MSDATHLPMSMNAGTACGIAYVALVRDGRSYDEAFSDEPTCDACRRMKPLRDALDVHHRFLTNVLAIACPDVDQAPAWMKSAFPVDDEHCARIIDALKARMETQA